MVLNESVRWGSKPTGSSPRTRNTPPRLGVCALTRVGSRARAAPAATPPSFSSSRRLSTVSIMPPPRVFPVGSGGEALQRAPVGGLVGPHRVRIRARLDGQVIGEELERDDR